MSRAGKSRLPESQGYTYIMVLVAVIIASLFAAVASEITSQVVRSEKEKELLFRGEAYIKAIRSYYHADGNRVQYPKNLEDLIRDPRFPQKSHIRELYADPFSKDGLGWNLVQSFDGGIAGVVSQSQDRTRKKSNFSEESKGFEEASTYSEWVFQYIPKLSRRKK